MGRTRYIGNYYLDFNQTLFLCQLYQSEKNKVLKSFVQNDLNQDQKRRALDCMIKATNFSYLGGEYPYDSTKNLPLIHTSSKDGTCEIIRVLAQEIGIVRGTLSFWEPQNWELEALAQGNLSELENLNLGNCSKADLQSLMGRLPELKRLRIRARWVYDHAITTQFISLCPKLEVLCLNTWSHPDVLANILKHTPNLKVLKISHLDLSENDFQALKEKIANGSLHTLDFSEIRFPKNEQWIELLQIGKDKLEGLVLNKLRISDVNGFLDALVSCTNLRRLSLGVHDLYNLQEELDDSRFKKLLCNNPNLEEIVSFHSLKITDTTLDNLMEHGKNLTGVYLHQTETTPTKIHEFYNNFLGKSLKFKFIRISIGCWYNYWAFKDRNEFEISQTHQRYWDHKTELKNVIPQQIAQL